jgi:bifunctional non-homologous end joining protein LigD
MESATPCAAPFDAEDWTFSVEWEGTRCLLFAEADGSVRLQGEMSSLDGRFPEIVGAGPLRGGRSAVLEGSICVLDEQGRPDVAALCGRAATGAARPAAVFLVSDLLQLDGEPLVRQPLRVRLDRVHALVPQESRIQLPDSVVAQGTALATAAAERGLSAIVARQLDAPYRPGVASPHRLRIALGGRRNLVVAGWYRTPGGLQVVLADWAGGGLAAAGVAAVPGGAMAQWLAGAVQVSVRPSLGDVSHWGKRHLSWVRPRLVATVEPLGGPAVFAAEARPWRLVALRDDVDPRWCVRRPGVAPPQTDAHQPHRGFSPTVLSALPLGGAA